MITKTSGTDSEPLPKQAPPSPLRHLFHHKATRHHKFTRQVSADDEPLELVTIHCYSDGTNGGGL